MVGAIPLFISPVIIEVSIVLLPLVKMYQQNIITKSDLTTTFGDKMWVDLHNLSHITGKNDKEMCS